MKEKIWADNFDTALRQQIINRFNQALIDHLQQVPLPSNKYAFRLYKRFLKHNKSILLFMSYQDLPSTNNGSERAIRNAKIHKKSQAASEIQTPLNDTPQYFLLSKLPKNKAFHYFMLVNL